MLILLKFLDITVDVQSGGGKERRKLTRTCVEVASSQMKTVKICVLKESEIKSDLDVQMD